VILVEAIPGMGEEGQGEWWRGLVQVLSYLIHYVNFCKCHNVPPLSTKIKEKKNQKTKQKKEVEKKKIFAMFCGSNNNDNSPVFIICILNRYH
jgi:hypothetical protein